MTDNCLVLVKAVQMVLKKELLKDSLWVALMGFESKDSSYMLVNTQNIIKVVTTEPQNYSITCRCVRYSWHWVLCWRLCLKYIRKRLNAAAHLLQLQNAVMAYRGCFCWFLCWS